MRSCRSGSRIAPRLSPGRAGHLPRVRTTAREPRVPDGSQRQAERDVHPRHGRSTTKARSACRSTPSPAASPAGIAIGIRSRSPSRSTSMTTRPPTSLELRQAEPAVELGAAAVRGPPADGRRLAGSDERECPRRGVIFGRSIRASPSTDPAASSRHRRSPSAASWRPIAEKAEEVRTHVAGAPKRWSIAKRVSGADRDQSTRARSPIASASSPHHHGVRGAGRGSRYKSAEVVAASEHASTIRGGHRSPRDGRARARNHARRNRTTRSARRPGGRHRGRTTMQPGAWDVPGFLHPADVVRRDLAEAGSAGS